MTKFELSVNEQTRVLTGVNVSVKLLDNAGELSEITIYDENDDDFSNTTYGDKKDGKKTKIRRQLGL